MANDVFGGLRAVIDEAMNVLWTMFNDASVTDENNRCKTAVNVFLKRSSFFILCVYVCV